jgi:hypothetical protein
MSFGAWGAASLVGPVLVITGVAALLAAIVAHGVLRWPTILETRPGEDHAPPKWTERVSVHLLIYGGWAVGFGAMVWRGVPNGMIDVRFPFERDWPVIESAEWIYLSVYVVPLSLPWLPVTRGALRKYAINLWTLLAISAACYVVLPFGSPPRTFVPESTAGRILAWETSRADFAAVALPSFHVFWGLLGATLLGTIGRTGKWIGRGWATAVAFSCVATGAHALADIAASMVIYAALAFAWRGAGLRAEARPTRIPSNAPMAIPPSPK